MRFDTIIAYAADGETLCPDCAKKRYGPDRQDPPYRKDSEGNDVHPCFVGYESDHPDHCGDCGDLIQGHDLTDEGVRYVLEQIADYLASLAPIDVTPSPRRDREVLKAWIGEWSDILKCPHCGEHDGLDGWRVSVGADDNPGPYLVHICNDGQAGLLHLPEGQGGGH